MSQILCAARIPNCGRARLCFEQVSHTTEPHDWQLSGAGGISVECFVDFERASSKIDFTTYMAKIVFSGVYPLFKKIKYNFHAHVYTHKARPPAPPRARTLRPSLHERMDRELYQQPMEGRKGKRVRSIAQETSAIGTKSRNGK